MEELNADETKTVPPTKNVDEFHFPIFSNDGLAPICALNPLHLFQLKGKFVKIEGWNALHYYGCIFTIDPVSLAVVLGRRLAPKGSIELEIVMGHIVKSIQIVEDHPWKTMISEDDFEAYLSGNATQYDNPKSLETKTKTENDMVLSYSAEALKQRKDAVKAWLIKNLLPIKEDGDSITVAGSVKIEPPYHTVSPNTGNDVIRRKIDKLLNFVPES